MEFPRKKCDHILMCLQFFTANLHARIHHPHPGPSILALLEGCIHPWWVRGAAPSLHLAAANGNPENGISETAWSRRQELLVEVNSSWHIMTNGKNGCLTVSIHSKLADGGRNSYPFIAGLIPAGKLGDPQRFT